MISHLFAHIVLLEFLLTAPIVAWQPICDAELPENKYWPEIVQGRLGSNNPRLSYEDLDHLCHGVARQARLPSLRCFCFSDGEVNCFPDEDIWGGDHGQLEAYCKEKCRCPTEFNDESRNFGAMLRSASTQGRIEGTSQGFGIKGTSPERTNRRKSTFGNIGEIGEDDRCSMDTCSNLVGCVRKSRRWSRNGSIGPKLGVARRPGSCLSLISAGSAFG